jgi:hypothetical protein
MSLTYVLNRGHLLYHYKGKSTPSPVWAQSQEKELLGMVLTSTQNSHLEFGGFLQESVHLNTANLYILQMTFTVGSTSSI